jgi:general secretion pathway protein D
MQSGGGSVSSEVLNKISGSEQPIYLTLNREHNLIIARTSDSVAMKEIERLIKEMDRPTPQVLLEMKILELGVGESYKQVFDIDYQAGGIKKGPGVWLPGDPLKNAAVVPITPAAGDATPDDSGYLGALARQHSFTAGAGELFYQFLNDHIRVKLDLLEAKNRVKTLNSPILLASNNKSARVFVGREQVVTTGYTVVAGSVTNGIKVNDAVSPTTELRNIGNTLQILPKINADRSVTLNIVQDTSSISENSATTTLVVEGKPTTVPIDTVVTSNIQSTVVAKDGLTVAIGGLISSSTSKSDTKVPILGDIPFFGELFKSKDDRDTQKEMILLITPHIITTAGEAEDVTRDAVEPISGPEW